MSTPKVPKMSSLEKAVRKLLGWPLFHLLTGHKFLIVQKPDPSTWSTVEHIATRWEWWPVPDAERVHVPRSRRRVQQTRAIEWPAMFWPLSIFWGEARPGSDGVMDGTPMQNGTTETRRLSYGQWEWGRKEVVDLPLPLRGWYWLRGYPVPSFDKHCVVVAPNGDVHELIQFDPNFDDPDSLLINQARGWGLWRDGVLVAGRAFTAARQALHRYVWTPWSHEDPHELALVLPDYVGGDGELTSGPWCGMRLALDRSSESYRRMVALGGVCAQVAEALVEFGAVVVDRNGYSASGEPHPPRLQRQAGGQWIATNAHQLRIDLVDLAEVVA